MRQGLCKEDNLTKANEKLKETNTSHKKGGGEGEPVPSRPGEKKKSGVGGGFRKPVFVSKKRIEVLHSQTDASLRLDTRETSPAKLLHWNSQFRFPFPYTSVSAARKTQSLVPDKKTEDAVP